MKDANTDLTLNMTIMANEGCKYRFSTVKDHNVCAYPKPGKGTCGVSTFYRHATERNDQIQLSNT